MVSFQCDEYVVSIGNQWNVSKKDLISVPDLFINYTHKFVVFKQAIDVQAFLLYIPFTPPLYELDWGVLAAYSLQRFRFKLGTHFRMYRISRTAFEENVLHHKRNIFEYFNMMYLVTYYINRPDKRWNVGFSLTNIDHFMINQETNPVFNLQMSYDIVPTFKLFLEGWYKSAGAFNLSVNPFGFFIRSGCVCKIQ